MKETTKLYIRRFVLITALLLILMICAGVIIEVVKWYFSDTLIAYGN